MNKNRIYNERATADTVVLSFMDLQSGVCSGVPYQRTAHDRDNGIIRFVLFRFSELAAVRTTNPFKLRYSCPSHSHHYSVSALSHILLPPDFDY